MIEGRKKMEYKYEDEENLIRPKQFWKDLDTHYLNAIGDEWYKIITILEHFISSETFKFYEKRGIKTLHLPITTGCISSPMGLGSDSSPVKVNLCGIDTYLADSMQFMLEYGCRIFEEGCFYVMPSFRGENADKRHLCQFYHSEAEIIGEIDDVIQLVEDYIKYLGKKLMEKCGDLIYSVAGTLNHIENVVNWKGGFDRITMDEAVALLDTEQKRTGELYYKVAPEGFKTLTSLGEQKLIEHFNGIVWLTNFKHLSLPFYQAFLDEDHRYAKNADLLFGIGEVVGLGQRHKNYTEVKEALDMHEVPEEEYKWYIEMKKRYPLQTSGFGMGIERFILWLLQHDDIRDCQILPRFNGESCMP